MATNVKTRSGKWEVKGKRKERKGTWLLADMVEEKVYCRHTGEQS